MSSPRALASQGSPCWVRSQGGLLGSWFPGSPPAPQPWGGKDGGAAGWSSEGRASVSYRAGEERAPNPGGGLSGVPSPSLGPRPALGWGGRSHMLLCRLQQRAEGRRVTLCQENLPCLPPEPPPTLPCPSSSGGRRPHICILPTEDTSKTKAPHPGPGTTWRKGAVAGGIPAAPLPGGPWGLRLLS